MFSNFSRLVENKFSFLISEYGFRCVFAISDFVRFESEDVFVSIFYDSNRSYEIGVEIGQLNVLFNDKERPFNLVEILRLEGVVGEKDNMSLQAIDSINIINVISRLSVLLSTYAVEFLKNSQFDFRRLSNFREMECNQHELQSEWFSIRREAQVAWRKKDYLKFIELYSSFKGSLSEVEKGKLAFAQKKVS